MNRIHVTVSEIKQVAGFTLVNPMETSDGTYRATFDLDESDDLDFVEEQIDADDNVVEFEVETR